MHRPSGKLAHVVPKGAPAAFPQGGCILRCKPVLQAFGWSYLAVSGNELIEGNLLGSDGVEAVVGPLGFAQIHKHFPVVVFGAGPVVERNEAINRIPIAPGVA